MYDEKNAASYLSLQRREEILKEFFLLNPHGKVVPCGGDTMLNTENYFATTRLIRQVGLRCLNVANGMEILTVADAERTILEGPHEISISLDSHLKDVHDWSRGLKGSYDMAVNALRMLVTARDKFKADTKIFAMAIISEINYKTLDEFYNFVLDDVGADKLKLNFLQPTFEPRELDFTFFRKHTVHDVDKLEEILNVCNTKYNLNINPSWLVDIKAYLTSVNDDPTAGWVSKKGTSKVICNSGTRNIMIDLYGNANLCFSHRFSQGTMLKAFGDLEKFWSSETTEQIRKQMETCNAYCGVSHSVRKENCTLK